MSTRSASMTLPPPVTAPLARGAQDAPRASARQRAKIAIITPWHPEPVDNGSKQRIRQVIAALADDFDIVLISLLADDAHTYEQVASVKGVWQQHILPLPTYHDRSLRALLAGCAPLPRSFVTTWDPTIAAAVARIVRDTGVALAIGADLRIVRYLLALPATVACLLDEANTAPFIAAATGARGLRSIRARARERKYARLLRAGPRALQGAIVASEGEARAYRYLAQTTQVTKIENSVGALPVRPWQPPGGEQLLYTGALSYGPNADAVSFFAQAILPTIAEAFPAATLIVTGARPATTPPALTARVTLTGWLDAAGLDAAYRTSRVCVVPLRAGTGTRIKLLEALAHGIPIVTTAKGAEGLDVIDGEHLLIADTPPDFAAATIRLLRDTALATQLGARGRAHVQRRYSWEARGRELRALVDDCLRQRGQGGR